MNFLELVNKLRVESGASGDDITVLSGNLPRETARLKQWTADAWKEIQLLHERHWRFLYKESTGFTVPVGASVLNPTEYAAEDVAEWGLRSFRIAPPLSARKDSVPLQFVDYYDFRDNDGRDPMITGKPLVFTVHPNTEAIHIAPAADAEYVLFYDYRKQPQSLIDASDIPIMPGRFHDLIVYYALEKYALFESAQEALVKAQQGKRRLLPELQTDQLPEFTTMGLSHWQME